MTGSGLIEFLRSQADLSKKDATIIMDLFFGKMTKALSSGERVEIRGLCSFYVKGYKGYTVE